MQLRHKAAALLEDKLACIKKHRKAVVFPELWLYLCCKGVSHAVSLISTNMLTTFSMLKSSHRPLKSFIYLRIQIYHVLRRHVPVL